MLFLILFLFSFELIVCSDRTTIKNPVEYSQDIVFIDQNDDGAEYLIGYVHDEGCKPFDKNKQIKLSAEKIINITGPRGLIIEFKDDKPYFCPYFDSIKEIKVFFENTSLDDGTKEILSLMFDKTCDVQKKLFEHEKTTWKSLMVSDLSNFITSIADPKNKYPIQYELKKLLLVFKNDCKNIVGQAYLRSQFFGNKLTPYFDIGMTLLLIAFLYFSNHNKKLFQPHSQRVVVMAYMAFMSIELNIFFTQFRPFKTSSFCKAYLRYAKSCDDLLKNEYFKSESFLDPSKNPFLDDYKNIPELKESLSTDSVDPKNNQLSKSDGPD